MTDSSIQRLMLAIYRLPFVGMSLKTHLGASLFLLCYDLYKSIFEVPGNQVLARYVAPGNWVIDVGANNGYFAERFARWVSGGGRVIAVEPDSENLALLRHRISCKRLDGIEICQAAAIEQAGSIHLQRNPERPDDHRVGDAGVLVAAVTIDDIVARSGDPMIALIKIDTQGSELRVLAGASRTLQRCKPALFIEIDDRALRDGGASAIDLVRRIETLGYEFFLVARNGRTIPKEARNILETVISDQRGYIDVLCVAS